jgi:hypothetical protein
MSACRRRRWRAAAAAAEAATAAPELRPDGRVGVREWKGAGEVMAVRGRGPTRAFRAALI